MSEINEKRLKSIEDRLTEIEKDIKWCEATKEQQWKTSLTEKVEDIGDKLKSVDNRLQQGQKTAEGQWIFNVSLTAIIFAGGFHATETIISAITEAPRSTSSIWSVIILFIAGVIGLLFSFRRMRAKRIKE